MRNSKLDTYRPDQLAKEDRQSLTEKHIKPNSLSGRPRIVLGNAIFFYKDERHKRKSIVNEWARVGRK